MDIGTPSHIGNGFDAGSVTSVAITVGAGGVPPNSQINVGVRILEAATSVVCNDTAGNTYVADYTDTGHVGGNMQTYVFRASNVSALVNTNTITVSWTTAVTGTATMAWYTTGLHATSPVDAAAVGDEGTSNNAHSGNITTVTAAAILMGYAQSTTSATWTQDSDFTDINNNNSVISGYRILSATETNEYAPTAAASEIWQAAVLAYKAAGGTVSGILLSQAVM